MLTINQLVTFAYESEYESAYDLPKQQLFSNPKIYTAKGDLSKRWYVYFSYRNPETGKLKRLTPFYGSANKYKTKEERLEVLSVYRKTLLKLLKQGYNPFADNSELFEKLNTKDRAPKQKDTVKNINAVAVAPQAPQTYGPKAMTISDGFETALNLKEKLVSERTFKDYKNKVSIFLKWLQETHPNLGTVDQLDKSLFQNFLNHILAKSSARNSNNYRSDLSSVLQSMEDNEIIRLNPIKAIKKHKSKPQRHKTYTNETEDKIFDYLVEHDPILLLFIKFYSYAFMRPIEACRVKVGDINLKDKTVQFKAKNSNLKTKRLPELLIELLPDLSETDPDHYLFTPQQIGGQWIANEFNRRNYFSKRFKTVVKDHFKLGTEYSQYSFRHTYTTKLYRELRQNLSPFEAKSRLMLITGHNTMNALEKYLRDIDAELPPDYSNLLKSKK